MRFTLPFSLLFFFSLSLSAQKNFEPGYLITREGDTITGKVRLQSTRKNHELCIFLEQEREHSYTPDDIRGFGYDEGAFFTTEVRPGFFAEKLVSGQLSLYGLYDKFYVKKDGELYMLQDIPDRLLQATGQANSMNVDWRSTLAVLISDCLTPSDDQIKRMGFSQKELVAITVSYNECAGGDFKEYKEELPRVALEYGIVTGGNLTSVRQGYIDDPSLLYMENPYTSAGPSLGVLVSATFPKNGGRRMSLDAELHVSRSSFQTNMVKVTRALNTLRHDQYIRSEMELTTLSLPLSIRYVVPITSSDLFFQGGLIIDMNIQNEGAQRIESGSYGGLNDDIAIASNNYFGPWGGLGVQHGFDKFHAGVALRYFYLFKANHKNIATPDFNRFSVNLIFKI